MSRFYLTTPMRRHAIGRAYPSFGAALPAAHHAARRLDSHVHVKRHHRGGDVLATVFPDGYVIDRRAQQEENAE